MSAVKKYVIARVNNRFIQGTATVSDMIEYLFDNLELDNYRLRYQLVKDSVEEHYKKNLNEGDRAPKKNAIIDASIEFGYSVRQVKEIVYSR